MIDCPDCNAARDKRWTGRYTAACAACEARRISRGPACAEAKRCGVLTPAYRAELRAAAERDHTTPLLVHELVRAWQQVDEAKAR